jgi:hypothetical protein
MSVLSKVLFTFVFLSTLAFLYLSARTLQTLSSFRSQYETYRQADQQRTETLQRLRDGDKSSQDPQQRMSIADLHTRLAGAIVNRGRAWFDSELWIVDRQNRQIGLRVAVPDPKGVPPVNSLVFLFEQFDPDPNQRGNQPPRFFGEYKVVQSAEVDQQNPNAVNVGLAPTFTPPELPIPWDHLQQMAGRDPKVRMVLYESMPRDSYEAFEGIDEATLAQMFQLPGEPELQVLAAAHRHEFLYHMKPVDQLPPDFVPTDDRIYVQVRFDKNFADLPPDTQTAIRELLEVVKPDPAGQQVRYIQQYLNTLSDPERQAIQPAEKLVQNGQTAWLVKSTADALVTQWNVATPVESRYFRPLRDFEELYRHYNREIPAWTNKVADARAHKDYSVAAVNLAQRSLQERTAFAGELAKENLRLKAEQQLVTEALQEIRAEIAAFQAERDRLAQENQVLAARLRQLQLEEAQRIEAAATAGAAR